MSAKKMLKNNLAFMNHAVRNIWYGTCAVTTALFQRISNRSTPFWLSWYHKEEYGGFELHSPWWITSYSSNGEISICAALRSRNIYTALSTVEKCYDKKPAAIKFRFCVRKKENWSPFCERFPRSPWMSW